ncbi:MAG TPA: MBL fold metallo-hydrolase [Alphaproteobacteria bacterium]|nr:MBL fold metallo-hydrolase [Alphaproteobacteria bacterium]
MKVTILGCGGSNGVPLIGGNWGLCNPQNPRNRRLRASILVEEGGTRLLVDSSPDLREQLLATGNGWLDAVLYTHGHADHLHGIDDLRAVNAIRRSPLPAYADEETIAEIHRRFGYVLEPIEPSASGYFYKPCLAISPIKGKFQVKAVAIEPFPQDHGFSTTLGLRFGKIAYSTDVVALDERAFEVLRGVELWIVDCLRFAPHPTHSWLDRTLAWIARVKPARAILTHMNHSLDYDAVSACCPPGVEPAYDGLAIEV